MHLPIEARRQVISLGGSRIREVANAAMGRSDVLPFWFGESDEATPAFIRQEAVRAIEAGETFYSQKSWTPLSAGGNRGISFRSSWPSGRDIADCGGRLRRARTAARVRTVVRAW